MRKPDVETALLAEVVRHALGSSDWSIDRTEEGVSTQVYRLARERETLYLRLGEGAAASLAPEVYVHRLLLAKGAKVPDVVHFEPFNSLVGRSLMVTTAIAGRSVAECREAADLASVLRQAGLDLALINSVPVTGFGWIRRDMDDVSELEGEAPSHEIFFKRFETDLEAVKPVIGSGEVQSIRTVVERHRASVVATEARLAHGDYDAASIFQVDGTYTGVIDFGEIRGTHPLYDLGHFYVHAGERLAGDPLRHVLEGYRDGGRLPDDHMGAIGLLGVMIGVSRLAACLRRPSGRYEAFLISSIRRILSAGP